MSFCHQQRHAVLRTDLKLVFWGVIKTNGLVFVIEMLEHHGQSTQKFRLARFEIEARHGVPLLNRQS